MSLEACMRARVIVFCLILWAMFIFFILGPILRHLAGV